VGAFFTALSVSAVGGRLRDAREYAFELLRAQRQDAAQHGGALFWLAASAAELGLDEEVRLLLAEAPDVWWADAARHVLAGDWQSAAAAYEGTLGPPHAFARLQAAKALVVKGRRAEADEQLHRALAFFRSVGATRFVRKGEALLAESA
jgi:hypothetical protein